MKKIFLLFVLAIATSACCNDDVITTPLEGDWRLIAVQNGWDPVPGQPPVNYEPSGIIYHIRGNNCKITKNGEIQLNRDFVLVENGDHYIFYLEGNDPEYEYEKSKVVFNNENNTVVFTYLPHESIMVLKKI